jgi:hypothetical protein
VTFTPEMRAAFRAADPAGTNSTKAESVYAVQQPSWDPFRDRTNFIEAGNRASMRRSGRTLRRVSIALSVAAVLAVAATATYATTRHASHPKSAAVMASTDGPVSAQVEAASLLSQLPSLPGAEVVSVAPDAALATAFSEPSSTNVVESTRWWTATSSLSDAQAFYRANAVPGTTLSGTGIRMGSTTVWNIVFGVDAVSTPLISAQLSISAVSTAKGVAIRADAQVTYVPTRSAAETIPSSVAWASGTLYTEGVARSFALDATDAATLGAAMNRLSPDPQPDRHCAGSHGTDDQVTFVTSGEPDIAVTVYPTGCDVVYVTVSDVEQPPLDGGADVDALLRNLVAQEH